jgi:signal transduction histidine kinase
VSRVVACVIALLAVAAAVAAVVITAIGHSRGIADAPGALSAAVLLVGVAPPACVGAFLIWRRPRTLVAWILVGGAFSVAVVMTAWAGAALVLHDNHDSALGAWLLLLSQQWLVLFAWPLALAYCYPDGGLPSPRWKPAAWVALVSCGLASFLLLFQNPLEGTEGDVPNPLGVDVQWLAPVFWVCWAGVLVSLFGGAFALRARYRAGDAVRRRQVLWLAYGAVLPPLWLGGSSLFNLIFGTSPDADLAVLMLVHAWLAIAVAVAVTRHGLYAIDRLFSRTLVYAVLTALLVATYALVAVLAGTFGDSALSASLATLAAALVFRPLRDRLQEVVDRRFARARFEGVRVLRGFLDDVRDGRAEPEEVGAVLRVALSDPSAEIFFRLPATDAFADRRGRVLAVPDDGRARSEIGSIGVLLHDPAAPPDLVRGVVDAAAVVVELARLRVELRLQLAEVEAARARIARAGYEERRRIERDLHDGAQQRLVTLGIVLRRLQRTLPGGLAPTFDSAVDEITATIADLRTIAAGLRPPRLDEGLSAALEDLARGATVPVEVEASGDRAPPEIEAVAYFVACEAVTNAVKHASPSRVLVRAARADGVLRLVVADDGVGGAATVAGRGLAGLADRVAASGGTLALESPVGSGTRIAVELPCVS